MEYEDRKKQLIAIMTELDLNFDWLNGVLSSDKIVNEQGEKVSLWLHFGYIRVVTKEDREKERLSGEMEVMYEWNTEKDGKIVILSDKKRGDD